MKIYRKKFLKTWKVKLQEANFNSKSKNETTGSICTSETICTSDED